MSLMNEHSVPYEKQTIYALLQSEEVVTHPLIQRITEISLTQEQIKNIALNIYHVVKNFPRFLSAIVTNIGSHDINMVLVDNLYEEYGRMNKEDIHVETYCQFMQQLGITKEEINQSKPHICVIAYVRSVIDLCLHHPYLEGLAALGVIEDIVHQVSDIIGVTANKKKKEQEKVYHFDEHKELDERHSDEIYDLLVYSNQEQFAQIERGLLLGIYYHKKLYTDILNEALQEELEDLEFSFAQESEIPAVYPLEVGSAGAKRLEILNRLYNPNSLALIKNYICKPEVEILEVGCGGGQLSYVLSQLDETQVTAVDNSLQQIDLAKSKYSAPNLNFYCNDALDLHSLGKRFDVIYLRWLLIYLPNAKAVIEGCVTQLKPGGVLIIEDNDTCASGCYSPDRMMYIKEWEKIWHKGIEKISGNTQLSVVVQDTLNSLNMTHISYTLSQATLNEADEKQLFAYGIEESRSTFLSLGFANALVDGLRDKFANIATSLYPVQFVRNFQITARKP